MTTAPRTTGEIKFETLMRRLADNFKRAFPLREIPEVIQEGTPDKVHRLLVEALGSVQVIIPFEGSADDIQPKRTLRSLELAQALAHFVRNAIIAFPDLRNRHLAFLDLRHEVDTFLRAVPDPILLEMYPQLMRLKKARDRAHDELRQKQDEAA